MPPQSRIPFSIAAIGGTSVRGIDPHMVCANRRNIILPSPP